MRRLTLILSDLYLPEETARPELDGVHSLPCLEWLLRMSDPPEFIDDWRAWLLSRATQATSVTDFCAAGAWFATPVFLESRLDHVRLDDRGLLRLDAAERLALRQEFERVVGPQLALFDAGERGFLLQGVAVDDVRTTDPARLLGADIGESLPSRDARELRRLGSEIEMWLHGSDVNAARDRARRPRVSALWLWRGPTNVRPRADRLPTDTGYFGADMLIDALNRARGTAEARAPATFADLPFLASAVVEFTPVSGDASEGLAELERQWFEPAGAALLAGAIDEVTIVANDRCFRTPRSARLRFWRRRRHWLARLGDGADPKA